MHNTERWRCHNGDGGSVQRTIRRPRTIARIGRRGNKRTLNFFQLVWKCNFHGSVFQSKRWIDGFFLQVYEYLVFWCMGTSHKPSGHFFGNPRPKVFTWFMDGLMCARSWAKCIWIYLKVWHSIRVITFEVEQHLQITFSDRAQIRQGCWFGQVGPPLWFLSDSLISTVCFK